MGVSVLRGPIELSIVIVNWNTGELLRKCVESVKRHPPRVPYDLVVVDNASSDGSADFLRARAAGDSGGAGVVRLIENAENVGFARANNIAIAHSKAVPLLFLLNPDTEVRPGAIDALLATLESQPRIGACAPRLLNADGSLQPSVWPMPPTPLYILVDGLRLYRLLPRPLRARWLLGAHWDHATRRPVPCVWAAAMMVKREMIAEVGAFDESFTLFGEDCEWCVRMRRGGWLIYLEPAAEVLHHGGRSALQRWTAGEVVLAKAEANIHYQRRVLGPVRFRVNQLAYCFVLAMLGLWRTVRRQPARTQLASCRIYWAAAWRGR